MEEGCRLRMRPIAAVHIVTGRIFSSAFPEQSLQTAPAKRALSVKEINRITKIVIL